MQNHEYCMQNFLWKVDTFDIGMRLLMIRILKDISLEVMGPLCQIRQLRATSISASAE
jgi:hypothetical protein